MMKMNSKKILSLILSLAISLSLTGDVLAFGGVNTLLDAKRKAEGFKEDVATKGICLRIDELSEKIDGGINQKEEKIEVMIEERLQNKEINRNNRDEKLIEFRSKADEWREANYKKLEAKAVNDEQKEAVEKFKETIETAVNVRRGVIDLTIDTFRDGVDRAIADHKTSVEEVKSAYRESVKAAFEKAKSDCDAGVSATTVRTNLKTSLQAARGQLKEDKAGAAKFSESMKTLIAAKKAAFEKAIADFKAEVQTAVAELKKSFPESSGE